MFGFYLTYFRAHPGYLVGWDKIVPVLTHGEHTIPSRAWLKGDGFCHAPGCRLGP